MTEDELAALAGELAPYLAQALLNRPSVQGPFDRLTVHPSVGLANTHLNTMCGTITIGENAFFAHHCSIITGTHDMAKTGRARELSWQDEHDNSIVIGEGVWIGENVTILGPCKIGDNAVIGAGSVVLPGVCWEGYLYVGVPARQIRKVVDVE